LRPIILKYACLFTINLLCIIIGVRVKGASIVIYLNNYIKNNVKEQHMQNKQALIGKARLIIEGLPALLKNTVTNKNRAAFIHGIKGHGGDYLFTRAGRFIS